SFMLKENMYQLPQDVIQCFVRFLNHQRIVCGNDEAEIEIGLSEQSPFAAGQTKCQQAHLLCGFQRPHNVRAASIDGKTQRDILRAGKHFDLAHKRWVRSICNPAAERGAIVGQGEGWQSTFADDYRMHKLNGDMLRVGSRSAIAKGKQASSRMKAACRSPACLGDTPCFGVEERL